MKRLLGLLLAGGCLVASLADQVTMKNGDRLTGTIVKSDDKALVIKSEFAGVVTVTWDSITAIQSKEPIHVSLKSGQTIVGVVNTAGDKVTIATADAGQVTTDKAAITAIRSKEEQAAYDLQVERFRNPRLLDLWAGSVDFGFALSGGNSQTRNLTTSANATRATTRDKIGVNFTSIYATSKDPKTGVSGDTADAIRGGINYSLNVSKKAFVFGAMDLEFDRFQKLDLRFSPNGGFGYYVVKNDRTIFNIFGGGSLNREFFSTGLNRTSAEVIVGEELIKKIAKATTLNEKVSFYPNVTETGQYRINFDASTVTALSKWLGLKVAFSDRYLSNPLSGNKKNDVLFTTGLRITFAK